jgi:hypothetical protein
LKWARKTIWRGVAILSAANALEALDIALQSADLEAAREFIEQAKAHISTLLALAELAANEIKDS